MTSGRVTVMIPSYNYGRYLGEAVSSAASQEHADVVIVDNGSTDDSPELGARLAQQYQNVRFVRYADNGGIITSFNRCREQIRGEYTVLLCADDRLAPGSLRRSVAFMDAHPKVGMAYGRAAMFRDGLEPETSDESAEFDATLVYRGNDWIERLCRTTHNPIATPEALVRTSVMQQVGRYEERTPHTSDLNLWLRIAAVADIAYLRGPVQACFRMHATNYSWEFAHGTVKEIEQLWAAFHTFFETVRDGRRTAWEALAKRQLTDQARYLASRAYVGLADGEQQARTLLELATRIQGGPPGLLNEFSWHLRRRLGRRWSKYFPGFLPFAAFQRLARERENRAIRLHGLP